MEVDTGKWLLGKMCKRYSDKVDVRQQISGPDGGPVQIDLQAVLLKPELLAGLEESEVLALRSAVAKLAAPVIEAVATPVAEVVTSVSPGAGGNSADAISEVEPSDSAGEGDA